MATSLRKQLCAFVQRRVLIERRASKRIVPVHRTLCLIQSSGGAWTTAPVYNISSTGVAVQSEQGYAPGTVLRILLVNETHTFSLATELNVVRSIKIGDPYLVAGTFARSLLHEEIVPFVW